MGRAADVQPFNGAGPCGPEMGQTGFRVSRNADASMGSDRRGPLPLTLRKYEFQTDLHQPIDIARNILYDR